MDINGALNIWGENVTEVAQVEQNAEGDREFVTLSYAFDPVTNIVAVTWSSPSGEGGARYLLTRLGLPAPERPPITADPPEGRERQLVQSGVAVALHDRARSVIERVQEFDPNLAAECDEVMHQLQRS